MEQKALRTSDAQRRASLKWERENNEKVTIKLRIGTDPSKAQIRAAAAAAREGERGKERGTIGGENRRVRE